MAYERALYFLQASFLKGEHIDFPRVIAFPEGLICYQRGYNLNMFIGGRYVSFFLKAKVIRIRDVTTIQIMY